MIFQAGSGGNLAVKGTYQTGSLPIACLVADFNGDHKLDVATIDQFGSMVDQFTGTGLGTFGKPTSYVVGDGPRWGAAADLNGDGLPDMAVANFNSGTITILASPTHATGFRVYVPPTATAGKAVGVTVTAVDAAGHLVPGFAGSVKLTSTDPKATLPLPYAYTPAVRGTHRFVVTLRTAGTQAIVPHAGTLTGAGTTTVAAVAATHLIVRAPTTATAGSAFDLAVVAADPYGNPDPSYTGTVHFTSTDLKPGVTLPADYAFDGTDGGTHTFNGLTLVTAGARAVARRP